MSRISATWLATGALISVALLAVNVGLAYHNTQELYRNAASVSHTHEVLLALESILSLAKDAETGQRGYLITGDKHYLAPYTTAVTAVHRLADNIAKLTSDNEAHQRRMSELRARIDAKLDELNRTIVLRDTAGYEAARAVVINGQGKAEMDALRAIVSQMTDHELSLLKERGEHRDRTFHLAIFEGLLSGLCALLAFVTFLLLYRRHAASRTRTTFIISEQSERLRTTLASIGDAVIATDTDARITMMNAIAESLTGWTFADARNAPLDRVFNIVNEASRKTVESPVSRALREGVIVGLANHTLLIAKDGTERPIDDSAAPIRCAKGELVGCVLVFRDITERYAVEASLRHSEARFRAIADNIPQLAWMIDSVDSPDAAAVGWFNKAWLEYTGTTLEQNQGQGWKAALHPDYANDVVEKFERHLREGMDWEDTFPLRGKDGGYRWFLSRMKAIRDESGKIVRFFGTNTDVTEQLATEENLRRAKEAAETANAAKDNFLSTLSHELRTPLTPVLGMLGAWEHAPEFPPALQEDLQMVRRNIDLEARLIDDLLDLTRIAKGKLVLNLEVLNVQTLLDSVVGMYRSEFSAKKIDFSLNTQADRCFVRADPGRLQQAFWNLLKNAVKFTAEGGKVDVSTRNDVDGNIQIIVHDNGIGMSPEMLARLFTPFEQENHDHLKNYGGLGLGLAITRMLLEAQNGHINAQSEGKYRGSTFVITLPCVEAPEVAPGQANPQVTDNGNGKADFGKCFKILLVEDHIDTANVLLRLMRSRGHEVTTVHSVSEAIRAITDNAFDILVSDIGLPDGTGIDVIRTVRQQHGMGVPAVALTGFGMEEDVARCIDAGFTDHLTKPINSAKLEETIQRLGTDQHGMECA